MATTKHIAFEGRKIPHLSVGDVEGGKCLAKHEPGFKEQSCFHRWQAFKKALENKGKYKLDRTRLGKVGTGRWSILFRGGAKTVNALKAKGEKHVSVSPDNKGMYLHEVNKPSKEEDWDVDPGNRNFKWDCNVPYYHEAHHVIPDATLRTGLLEVFKKNAAVAAWVAEKMLDAPYCVHHKDNMLILPMDQLVGEVLELPIHRETKQCSHNLYDIYILSKVKEAIQEVQEQIMEEHDKQDENAPKTKNLAKSLETVARTTYEEVAEARKKHGIVSVEEIGRRNQ
ncbi:AHH domain-containing protein [Archangium lansingense]|uniref:AHH domain-containing protein n=1 Tax=Archangium lansingense TaxID=2995310 RepID=A0ABT4A9J1_9BACT|nr:AHH domain-containing protein [Archangium lansinium]MCY1078317.1 AHH domain-containing protein [Archangium lansinium]